MNGLPIVVIDITPWRLRTNRAQSLARGFAWLGRQVIYVEQTPGYRYAARGRGYVGALFHRNVAMDQGVQVCESPAFPVANRALLYKWSLWVSSRQLQTWLRQRVVLTKAIWIASHPRIWSTLEAIRPQLGCLLYDVADDWMALSGAKRYYSLRLAQYEFGIAEAADHITVVSHLLASKFVSAFPEKAVWLVRNGVDYERFANATEIADEIKSLPHPVLGLVGTLGHFVDVGLLETVARAFPTATLVLVGPAEVDLSALHYLPNVYLLGWQSAEKIPSFIRGFDVGLNPRPLSQAGLASDPTKVYEYLAAGVPVVSTRLPQLDNDMNGLVFQAGTPDEFCAAIESILSGRTRFDPAEARQVASRNTWVARCQEILDLCSSKVVD